MIYRGVNMETRDYFFVISVPKDELLEYTRKLNSYLVRLFPDKKNPYVIKPLEIGDTETLAKIVINATEEEIMYFADRFFGQNFELIEREKGEIEIAQTEVESEQPPPDDTVVKH